MERNRLLDRLRDVSSGQELSREHTPYRLNANVFNITVDPTCPYCQLEAEDMRHTVCRCPIFHDDRVYTGDLLAKDQLAGALESVSCRTGG